MENLGIDGKLLLAQLVNFVLFFIIFKKLIAKPFGKFLQQERKNEKDKETLLNKLKKGEESLAKTEQELRDKIRRERTQILEKSQKEALLLRDDIVAEAKKEADAIKQKAYKEVEEERTKLHQDIKNKVADLSMMVITTALKDYLDEDSKKKVTSYILKNAGTIASKYEN